MRCLKVGRNLGDILFMFCNIRKVRTRFSNLQNIADMGFQTYPICLIKKLLNIFQR
jgi:hypothetical protein